ncbi:nitrogen regulatory protein P-II [Ignicoccus pacificus DSM 13166]|uniref:Nitrogen regulatory protein P-II n=1 Tax=Ignicoccus pacificus DSM 13166 TaxID=940294 RepID=A0A977K912_9CREN|nr:nitrogen regulatory protein P-II [Ignicoccus pacificus DSM 13166]
MRNMKMVIAFIRPEKLDDVKAELEKVGIYPMTVVEVKGRGSQKGIEIRYRGLPVRIDLLPKIQLELVLDDDKVEDAIKAITKGAYTGEPGDGRIIVLPVEKNIKIRDYYKQIS